MDRYLLEIARKDLESKMLFIAGPRQVGKTTLALGLLEKQNQESRREDSPLFVLSPTSQFQKQGYLSWDIPEHRECILSRELPNVLMWAFDELHKFRGWRDFLKGLFDLHRSQKKILVTGSAMLDVYRFGGDSLQGRYHFLRLYPLSVAELKISTESDMEHLLMLNGFPEPFFKGEESFAKRWSLEYRSRLIQEEVSSIEQLKDLSRMELLLHRLPSLVGSSLSINSLREDLQISHDTVSRWIEVFERFYALFRVPPFGSSKIRAIKKTNKHYHFDWSLVKSRGARIENFFAVHLLKWLHFERDSKGRDLELRYFRDVDGREVDFVVLEDNEPLEFIEVKAFEEDINPALKLLKARFPEVNSFQLHFSGERDYVSKEGITVMPMIKFLQGLV